MGNFDAFIVKLLAPEPSQRLHVSSLGGGRVTSSPAGIDCGTRCMEDFATATPVALTPNPNEGLTFNGWLGACAGTSPCQIEMSQHAMVMASFGAQTPSQYLILQGTVVTDSPAYRVPRIIWIGPGVRLKTGSHLSVTAGEQIRFLPTFAAERGARFTARIDPSAQP